MPTRRERIHISLVSRYLGWLSILKPDWNREKAEALELEFLSKAGTIDRSFEGFSVWLDAQVGHKQSIDANLPEREIRRLWKRWREFFVEHGSLPLNELEKQLYARDQGLCRYCHSDGTGRGGTAKHHVLPQSKKGPTCLANLVLACRTCNTSIGNTIKFPEDWVFGVDDPGP